MIESATLALLLLASGPAPAARGDGIEYAQITIRQRVERVIVRVRTPRPAPPPSAPKQKWTEKKGPRCMATDMIAGAAVTADDSVDFALKGGTRLRARLESDCPALDYYGGFYLAPTPDGKICADRDAIHARSGGACDITRFRMLVPGH